MQRSPKQILVALESMVDASFLQLESCYRAQIYASSEKTSFIKHGHNRFWRSSTVTAWELLYDSVRLCLNNPFQKWWYPLGMVVFVAFIEMICIYNFFRAQLLLGVKVGMRQLHVFVVQLRQHNWRMHTFQTYGLRFSRGTQRFQSVAEIGVTLSVAFVSYFLMNHFLSVVALRVGLSLTADSGVMWFVALTLTQVVKILAFAAGACVGHLAVVGALRWWYPNGTGYGAARLHVTYLPKETLNSTRAELQLQQSLDSLIERFANQPDINCSPDGSKVLSLVCQHKSIQDFTSDLSCLYNTDKSLSRRWLLNNMIDALRRFKNMLKRLDTLVLSSGQSLHHRDLIQALTQIVHYMKNPVNGCFNRESVALVEKKLESFLTACQSNDRASSCQNFACVASILVAVKTLLEFEDAADHNLESNSIDSSTNVYSSEPTIRCLPS